MALARGRTRTQTRTRPSPGWTWLLAALCAFGVWQFVERGTGEDSAPATRTQAPSQPHVRTPTQAQALPAFLPPEARATLVLIDGGGPFPHRQDGTVFQNREGLLPQRPRGHYREYTVDTPGLGHRGARRIVTGGHPPAEWYYTGDHYRSFRAFRREGRP